MTTYSDFFHGIERALMLKECVVFDYGLFKKRVKALLPTDMPVTDRAFAGYCIRTIANKLERFYLPAG